MSSEYSPVVWVDGTTVINAARLTAMQQQYLLTAGLRTLDAVPSGAPTDGSNVCLVDGLLYVWNGTAWTSSENAVAAEASARQAADTTLQGNIDSEASARATADSALQTSVNSNAGAITALQTSVATKADDADVLHTTGNESKSGNLALTGDLSITGNVTQNGSQYITHAEQVQSTDDYIYLRYGATGALAAGAYTGIEFVKYDGTNDGRLVVDNTGTARVGDVGSEQPLLTRAESASMTTLALMYWDATTLRALTLAAGTSGQVLQSNGSSLPSWRNVDTAPTSGSTNPVTSGGVYTADQGLQTNITAEASARSAADTTLQTNIDAKQPTVNFVTVTAAAASWSSGTQTVTVTGMTATANATIGITAGQAAATYAAILAAQIDVTAQAANAVTLTCYGDAPSMDVQLTLALFG